MKPRAPFLEVWAWVARAPAQARSQWLAGLRALGLSLKTQRAPAKCLRRANKAAASAWSLRGKRFLAVASWFMRAKPRSDFLAEKLTGVKRLRKCWAAP